jgi:hypothetical protein
MEEQSVLSREALLGNAEVFDSGEELGNVEPAKEPTPDAVEAKDPAPASKGTKAEPDDKADSSTSGSEEAGQAQEGSKSKSKWAASEERKSKSWKEVNAEKDSIKKERETLNQEREQHKAERAEFDRARIPKPEEARDTKGYTAKDYEDAAESFRRDGDDEMAEAANRKAQQVRTIATEASQKAASDDFNRRWSDNYAKLSAKDESLKDEKSETYQGIINVLQRFPMLKNNPEGLTYAYEAVMLDKKSKSIEGTVSENKKLREELEKYKKKLAIGGSDPTEPLEGEKPFEKLSKEEQRKRLVSSSEEFDRYLR